MPVSGTPACCSTTTSVMIPALGTPAAPIDASVAVPDIMDHAITAAEAVVDPALRLVVAPGLTVALPMLRAKLDEVKVPAQDAAGTEYEVGLRSILASLLFDSSELA